MPATPSLAASLVRCDRVGGVVADGAGDDRDVDGLDDGGEHAQLLVVGQRRRLAGGAADDEAVVAFRNQVPGQLLGDVEVDRAGGVERGDHRRHQSAEVRHQVCSWRVDRADKVTTTPTVLIPDLRPTVADLRTTRCGRARCCDLQSGLVRRRGTRRRLDRSNERSAVRDDTRRTACRRRTRRHRHRRGRLHRSLRPRCMGKRFDAGFFLDEAVADGTHGCDYLLTADMEMEPVPGLRATPAGTSATATSTSCPTCRRCASPGGPTKTAFVLCDVVDDAIHSDVSVAPRSILRRQIERLATRGLIGDGGVRARVLPVRRQLPDRPTNAATPASDPAGWYIEDYHLLQGAASSRTSARPAARSAAPASRSRTPRASGAGASTSSTSATPMCSRWPTATPS